MNKQIPDFLVEMSKQMNEQTTRCTSHPFWQVRCKRYLVTKEGYNESHWEIAETEEGLTLYHSVHDHDYKCLFDYISDYEKEWLIEWALEQADLEIELNCGEFKQSDLDILQDAFEENFDPDWQDMPENLKKFHMQEIEEVITTHFTQADAEWFIKRKQHDYPKLYTYVESAYWSPQLRELQDWIKGLTDAS